VAFGRLPAQVLALVFTRTFHAPPIIRIRGMLMAIDRRRVRSAAIETQLV
jgi:hypothetical protein